jgi:hypothetical protein
VGPTLQITFDANAVNRLVEFWAEALGYERQAPPPGFDTWEDFARANDIPEDQWDGWGALVDPDGRRPRLFFQRVPEGKTAKNRVHLDVNVGEGLEGDARTMRVKEEADRIEALGATRQREATERGEFWIVMEDPEGNRVLPPVTITIDVATRNGLHRFDVGGTTLGVELDGRDVSSLAPAGDERWAILDRREVWHDGGDGWT